MGNIKHIAVDLRNAFENRDSDAFYRALARLEQIDYAPNPQGSRAGMTLAHNIVSCRLSPNRVAGVHACVCVDGYCASAGAR